jgi:hypothetical protein
LCTGNSGRRTLPDGREAVQNGVIESYAESRDQWSHLLPLAAAFNVARDWSGSELRCRASNSPRLASCSPRPNPGVGWEGTLGPTPTTSVPVGRSVHRSESVDRKLLPKRERRARQRAGTQNTLGYTTAHGRSRNPHCGLRPAIGKRPCSCSAAAVPLKRAYNQVLTWYNMFRPLI